MGLVVAEQKDEPLGLVYSGGTYDLLHPGHINFLRQCADYGEVVVALNTDEFITQYKGRPPVMTYDERAYLLEAVCWVSKVVPNTGGADSKETIELIQPDVIAVGSDWVRRDYHAQMSFTQDWLDERNIHLLYIPYTQGISTTELKRRINAIP